MKHLAACIHLQLDLELNSDHIALQEIILNLTLKLYAEAHAAPNLGISFMVSVAKRHFPQALPLVLIKCQLPLFWGIQPSCRVPALAFLPSTVLKLVEKIEIFHLLDYASTLKLLPGNVNARRNFLETVSELKLHRRVAWLQ